MNPIVSWLAPHLPLAAAALTLLLALGCGCLSLVRSPAHRQRIGELTVAGALLWLILAAIPLPRLLPEKLFGLEPRGPRLTAEVSTRRSGELSIPKSTAIMAPISVCVVSDQPAPIITSEAPDKSDSAEVGADALPVASGVHNVHYGDGGEAVVAATVSAPIAPWHGGSPALAERATDSAQTSGRSVLEFAAWVFLAGAAATTIWLLLGHALLARERFSAAAPQAWLYRLFQGAAASSPGRLPRLVVSRCCSRPVSWGILRPMIALPERLCQRVNSDQLRTVLLHELGHVRRGDACGNLLFELAFPLLFFHPLYWWLRTQARMAAELVADDWAAQATGKELYVAELIALARGSRTRRLALLTGSGVYSNPSQFYRRMKMLLSRENPLETRMSIGWRIFLAAGTGIAVTFAAALAGVNPAAAQEPLKPPAVEAPAASAQEAPKTDAVDVPTSVAQDPRKPGTEPVEPQTTPPIGVSAGEKASETAPEVPASSPPGVAPQATNGAAATHTLSKPAEVAPTDTERLKAEQDELRKQVHDLMARIKELDRASEKNGAAVDGNGQPARIIQLTRPGKNGTLTVETWAIDEKGQPDRIMSKSQVAGEAPLPAAVPPNKPQNADRPAPALIEPPTMHSQATAAYNDFVQRAGQPPVERAVNDSRQTAVSTRPLDLVALATSYADAVGAVQMARATLAEAEQTLTDQGQARQLNSRRVAVENAIRKERLLRRIAEAATAGAKQDYERAVTLHANGAIAVSEMTEFKARLEILEQILGANDSEAKPATP